MEEVFLFNGAYETETRALVMSHEDQPRCDPSNALVYCFQVEIEFYLF